jgi:hypothetical protein
MGDPSDEAAEALYNTGRYPGVVTFTLEMSYNFYALGHKHPAPLAGQLTSGFHHVGLPSMTTSIIVVISTHPQNEISAVLAKAIRTMEAMAKGSNHSLLRMVVKGPRPSSLPAIPPTPHCVRPLATTKCYAPRAGGPTRAS